MMKLKNKINEHTVYLIHILIEGILIFLLLCWLAMLLNLLLRLFDIISGCSNYRDCWPPCKSSLIWEDEQKQTKWRKKEQEGQTGQKSRAAVGTAGEGEQRSFIGTRERRTQQINASFPLLLCRSRLWEAAEHKLVLLKSSYLLYIYMEKIYVHYIYTVYIYSMCLCVCVELVTYYT